ncbi:unnamed protein product [Adineta ricciae]|uniref:PDZ domain-containing protein n=1 Tax=Adineta ricciae TaxID=249248 RepID=A0A816AL51_ADIRI|nr:unnamed protein product [Adineta ricciae]
MQRAIVKQRLGITLAYHKRRRVHYLRLIDRSLFSLAYRAGLKDYDRIISLNGIIIENDTPDKFKRRFCLDGSYSIQLLVCNRATYEHYKSNSKALHSGFPTVQQLVPVYATTISDSDKDIPMIHFDEQSRKGNILFVGHYEDCEELKEQYTTDQLSRERSSQYVKHGPLDFSTLMLLDKTMNWILVKSFISSINRLVIDTSNDIDLKEFANLQQLVLCNKNSQHISQIDPKVVHHLTHLSFLCGSKFIPPQYLAHNVFSAALPSLRHVDLGCINS